MNDTVIETQDLRKSFKVRSGKQTQIVEAVKGINLRVKAGEIFGFLGPNGAGKTTTLRMLATLLPPDSGQAVVAGYDLRREPGHVRRCIGYVSQAGGSDVSGTARENVMLQAQLYGLSKRDAAQRTDALLQALELESFADRVVSTYSGGQRRRLDIALGMVHSPTVLFLDEPTTGLDPQSRAHLWDEVRRLHNEGTTIFLTTHYLEEADMLADRLAIIDDGVIVAEDTPNALKQQIAGDVVTLRLNSNGDSLRTAQTLLGQQPFVREVHLDGKQFQLYVEQGDENLPAVLHLLDGANLPVQAVTLARPTLDDVFLRKTGRSLREVSQ